MLKYAKYFLLRCMWWIQAISLPGTLRIRKFIRQAIFTDKYIQTPYLGFFVFVCPTHIMGKTVFEGGIHEPELTKTIQAFTQAGFSFLDIGANIGLHTLGAVSTKSPQDQIFVAFEPDPHMFSVLKKNCRLNGLDFVTCIQAGLGDKDTFLTLNSSQTRNKGHNSFLPIENAVSVNRVKVSALDTLYADDVLSAKDIFVKIDVEGYELPVIQGGKKFFSQGMNMVVVCEVWAELMEKNNFSVDALYQTLSDCGFSSHILTDDGVIFYKGPRSTAIISKIFGQQQ